MARFLFVRHSLRRAGLCAVLVASALVGCRPDATPAAATPAKGAAVEAAKPAGVATESLRAAVNAALAERDPRQRSRDFGRALQTWLERDAEGALAFVRSLPSGADRTQGVLMSLTFIGRSDPDRALTLARELVRTREEQAFYSALFAQVAAQSPADGVRRLALVPEGEGRFNAVRAVADAWARTDAAGALTWAQGLGAPMERAAAVETLATGLAATDPLRAIELAQRHLTGPVLERTLLKALLPLTETDPAAAAAIVRLLPAGATQTLATAATARALAGRSPAEALAWAATLPGIEPPRIAVNNVLEIWVRSDAAAARNYVGQLPAGGAQDAAAAHLGRVTGAADPQAAVAWAQTLGGESARSTALVNIASAWAQRDAPAAARWAAEFPSAVVQREGLAGVLTYWVQQDPAAARTYAGGLAGEGQVHAVAAVAPALAQGDPVGALTWAQSLPAPAAREAAVAAAYARWLENKPVAARSWLETAALAPEFKARLRATGTR